MEELFDPKCARILELEVADPSVLFPVGLPD